MTSPRHKGRPALRERKKSRPILFRATEAEYRQLAEQARRDTISVALVVHRHCFSTAKA